MKVAFVNPPCSDQVTVDLAPPLWALVLAAVAERHGHEPMILDLNLELHEDHALRDARLYPWAVERILAAAPDVVCFSSMGVNSHVSLELARHVKHVAPTTIVAMGGPHLGLIAEAALDRWSWVDVVFRGEADDVFGPFLDGIARRGWPIAHDLPGLYHRQGASVVGRPRERPVTPAEIPWPAYHRIELARYFAHNPAHVLDLDAARRGCRFACTFCYAPAHFGRGERHAPVERLLGEIALGVRLGARRFFLVQDNFVNSPRETVAICREIAAARLGITFHAYATLAQLDEDVVEALAAAGCDAVYVGVDAVHDRARRAFAKHLYRGGTDMLRRAHACLDAGITPTFAFLLEHPLHDRQRFEATMEAAAAARSAGCRVRLNTLTPYPGTPLHARMGRHPVADDLKPRLAMDLPPIVQCNPLAAEAPALFPFHSTYLDPKEYEELIVGAHIAHTLLRSHPGTMKALAQGGRSWDTIERIRRGIEREEFLALDDSERRHRELRVFAGSVDTDVGSELRAERLVLDLLARPAWPAGPILPFAFDAGSEPALLAVLRDGRVEIRPVSLVLAPTLADAAKCAAAHRPPPLELEYVLTRMGLMREVAHEHQDGA